MLSVKNDDEPVETVAVEAAQERVATVSSVWASVEARLMREIKLTAWTCEVRRRRTPAPGNAENEGEVFSATRAAFKTRFSL